MGEIEIGAVHLSASQMSVCLDCSREQLRRLEAAGVIAKRADGTYDLVETTRRYVQHLRERPERERKRDRLDQARAQSLELRTRREAGQLCETSDFNEAVQIISGAFRSKHAGFPARHFPQDLGERRRLEAALHTMQNEVADIVEATAADLERQATKSARRRL